MPHRQPADDDAGGNQQHGGQGAVFRMCDALKAVEQQREPQRREEKPRPIQRLGIGRAVARNEARDQRQPDEPKRDVDEEIQCQER
ncbi:hypothetical protein X736_07805 [Mesorhizobium sp. L2C089B000]|nr:hypothetical protein X736_07805 [Mesorhizobium sp. L2C089B000]